MACWCPLTGVLVCFSCCTWPFRVSTVSPRPTKGRSIRAPFGGVYSSHLTERSRQRGELSLRSSASGLELGLELQARHPVINKPLQGWSGALALLPGFHAHLSWADSEGWLTSQQIARKVRALQAPSPTPSHQAWPLPHPPPENVQDS